MGFVDRLLSIARIFKRAKRTTDAYSGTYGTGTSSSGFAGGAVSRLTASLQTWSGAVNVDLDGSLEILRARGRQLAQNNEHGRRFLSLVATNIVGSMGPKLQVRAMRQNLAAGAAPTLDKVANDAIETHWMRWCKGAEITGRMDFAHLCRVVVKAVARDGEALVRLVRARDLPYGIALQLLEIDRLEHTLNLTLDNGTTIRQGVEIDSAGRPIAYHIRVRHPGDRFGSPQGDVERVPVSQLRHIFLPERAEQVRGYTWFHAVIVRTHQLHGFSESAVIAARIGASKIAALERPDDQAPGGSDTMGDAQSGGALSMNVEAGEMFELPPGYKLNSWNPEYPHANFESFVKQALHGISVGVDVANHNLTGDMTGVNYSSARIAELTDRDLWITLQAWFHRALPDWVYGEWLATALLRGDITFPDSGKSLPADKLSKFLDAGRFQGRRWSWVDPQKEINAAKDAVALGITSRTRLAAERGDDFDDILDELKQEQQQLREAGLLAEDEAAPLEPEPAE